MADITDIKPLGVRTPQGQNRAREDNHERTMQQVGKPNTVVAVSKMDTYLLQFFDAKGVGHSVLLHHVGDQFLMHKNDEEWAKALRTAKPWVIEQVKKLNPKFADGDVKVKTDVDIMMEDEDDVAAGSDAG